MSMSTYILCNIGYGWPARRPSILLGLRQGRFLPLGTQFLLACERILILDEGLVLEGRVSGQENRNRPQSVHAISSFFYGFRLFSIGELLFGVASSLRRILREKDVGSTNGSHRKQ